MTTPTPVVAPLPETNEADAVGQKTAQSVAREILRAHRSGLNARRERDLISEKLLLHIDGSGDNQWADILYGTRVEIPRLISEFRKTENLLRLVVDNAVAHHTTMPVRYVAESTPDRAARSTALVDALVANHVAQTQDFNGQFAEALYLAMPAGFCPMHAYWRDDDVDHYESVLPANADDPMAQLEKLVYPKPGIVDCWVGNPFDTVFNRGAKRGSIHWCSYGRVLPAHQVRDAFAHVPGVQGLEGTTKLPSAAMFQRIARNWRLWGLDLHGSSTISYRRHEDEDEELMVVVCREILPGLDADWPNGRLQIIAVPGAADLRVGEGQERHAVLLADQALPGGDFSFTNFYSHHRNDDVHGKPWVEDLDQLQVDLNIALSKRWEYMLKMVEAPIVSPGGALTDDMLDLGGYNILEIDPSMAGWRPQVMRWETAALDALSREVEDKRRAIYTAGGYQASSRGEAPGSRMAYRAIVALQQADNSVHGPVHMRFQRSSNDFARRVWKQIKAYADVPFLAEVAGDEYAHLAEPWVNNTMLSNKPPKYKTVNAFGASPELKAQEVLELMRTVGADGVPFMTTAEAKRRYPNQELFDAYSDPASVAKRRAKAIVEAIFRLTREFREQAQFFENQLSHPWVLEAAKFVFMQMEEQYPRLRDDDLTAHLNAMSEITQDETADSIARLVAMRRQDYLFELQRQMAEMMMPQQNQRAGVGGQVPQQRLSGRTIAQESGGTGGMPDDESPSAAATAQ